LKLSSFYTGFSNPGNSYAGNSYISKKTVRMEPLSPTPARCGKLKKFFTIAFAVYFGLQLLGMLISFELLPGFLAFLTEPFAQGSVALVKWTGANLLHLSEPITRYKNFMDKIQP
jgi:hypothetical protein